MARPMGARAIKIDPIEVAKIARTGATQLELALKLGVSINTVERRLATKKYRDAWEGGRGDMLISLRAKQIEIGLKGNVIMLKWLGEQYLGQAASHRVVDQDGKDRPIVDVSPTELLNARIAGILDRKRESGGTPGV